MEHVLNLIPIKRIDNLLADCEFIGHEWLDWLRQNKLSCRILVKSNNVEDRSKKIAVGKLCTGVSINQKVTWHSKKKVSGVPFYIAARRNLKGLLIVVATKQPGSIIDDYSKRWSIETMFGNLKSRGFDLESTHMTNLDRMDKLMELLTITVVWCLLVGHWCYGSASQLPLNKYYRPAKSLFRLGLDRLRRVLKNNCAKKDQTTFLDLLNVLSHIGNRHKVFFASAVVACQLGFVQAAGFSIHEHSASAMGTAFAGRASNGEDASIGASNPAGMAVLESRQLTVGSAVILENGNFKNGSFSNPNVPASSSKNDNFLKTTAVPFGHIVLPFDDRLTVGWNAYAPFGLNLDYDKEFVGRYFGDKALIETVNFQSVLAYKVEDDLFVGIGLTLSHINGELSQKKYVSPIPSYNNIDAVVKGDDYAFTWNVGVIWRPYMSTTLGASYHAQTKFNLEGDVKASNVAGGLGDFKHKAELKITMPERVMLSATHQLDEQWTIMADATWTRWSRLDSISVVDKEGTLTQNGSTYVPMHWKDVWAMAVGVAYKVDDQWTLKAGYMFDQSPVSDSTRTVRSPDNDRHWITAGVKWSVIEDIVFDFSAAYVMLKDGKIDEKAYNVSNQAVNSGYGSLIGEYEGQSTWILSAQMTYRF
ncbi:MAG: outer membrane protein transport protein [Candidatus Endonucleobacter sp. (ex Gigantidas childressi)]|nr:outer membrane protein transport protein [Candidatus Endonucleobacter sp. (ex Gigantidas childressi)]